MRQLRALLSWTVATPVLAYVMSALLVVSVVQAFVARNEASDALRRTTTASARQIDRLQHEINYLQTRLRNTSVRDARERGRLEGAIQALAEQIRQAGGTPVTVGQARPAQRPQPSPAPSRTASPRPTPSHSPTPHPTPSQTPCRLHDLLTDPTSCLHL